jgi:hypothetical protein
MFDDLVDLVLKRERNTLLCLPEHIWSRRKPPGRCGGERKHLHEMRTLANEFYRSAMIN